MESLRLTQEELKELLRYNPDTGVFTWVKPVSKRIKVGTIAGSDNDGSTTIVIKKNVTGHIDLLGYI